MLSSIARLVTGPLSIGLVMLALLIAQVKPQELTPGSPLVVTTFNLRVDTEKDLDNRWDMRKDFALQVLRQLGPDILGTQEPLFRQVAYLEHHLAGYERFGGGRDDGKEKGEFAAIFLRRMRFAVHDSGTFWLSETPTVAGSKGWGAGYPRIATWVRATDIAAGREVMIMNAHFDHKNREARLQGARLIRRWLEEHAASMPVIFLGDLNAREETAPVQAMLEPGPGVTLSDAYRAVHPARQMDESSLSVFTGRVLGSRIDFIFHTPHFHPTSAVITRTARDNRYPSDHYPVTVTLAWK